jgi:serine/threonine-protein kinase
MADLADPTVSRVERRSFHATTQEGREYLQRRIALFARVMFLLLGTYLIFVVVARSLWGAIHGGNQLLGLTLALSLISGLGALWWYAAGRPRSPRMVTAIDYACVTDPCTLIALTVYLMRDVAIAPFGGYAGVSMLILGRALIVPSTARRTALASSLAVVPMLGANIALEVSATASLVLPRGMQTPLMAVWFSGVIILASYGSAVLYGLREQVREARQLGQYTLLGKIGEGGMGVVYRARHAMLRRPTAIKLLPPAKAGEQQLERFEREVQHTAELTHPNTVQIYDYGRSPDGVFYYAMEWLDGIDLESLVVRFGCQSEGRVVHVLEQACGALAEAHERGLVHRDVKPANLFLCHRGGIPDVVKVLDFGLVKELDRAGPSLTAMNVVAGTPAFLAPEAITAPDTVGPAADLYALGAVGYYLLTGQPVFGGATVVEICGHHVHSEPVPPSRRRDEPLSEELEAIILRCLAKDPAARFPSARQLGRALGKLGGARPWSEVEAEAWWTEARAVHPDLQSRCSAEELGVASTIAVDLSERQVGS